MKTCPICQTKFPEPIWPNTKQKYCSPKCGRRASYLKNPKRHNLWAKLHPKRSREIKRKWNWSEKGKECRRKWYQLHKKEIMERSLAPKNRKALYSRISSRRKLLRRSSPTCCICKSKHLVQAHHKDFNSLNKDIKNLEWLCKKCHMDKHHQHNLLNITNSSNSA